MRLLGAPEVLVDGRTAAMDTRKAIAVLAVIAIEGRPVRRDTLAGMLWPEASQDRARATLRRTLSTLRGAIGADALIADREVVELGLDAGAVDVVAFERLAESEPERALDLYRGPFLEGFSVPDAPEFEEWSRVESERLRQRVDGLLADLGGGPDPAAASRFARRRLLLDPLSEDAARQAMAALGRADDRAGAVAVYRELVRRLHEDLGVDPLPRTTEVYEAVRRGEGAAAEPPAVASRVDPRPARPAVAGPLIGREAELAALTAAVKKHSLVFVTGEPGVGRTRFVEEWAGEQPAVTVVRCHRGEQGLPLAPFSGWLTRTRESSQIRLFEAIASEMPIGVGGVLVIDDLDEVDADSLAFLTYVVHRPDRFGWTVVATWGNQRIAVDDLVWDLLAEGRREGWATEVALGRLGPGEISDLALAAGVKGEGRVESVVTRSEGLPLLAVELARPESRVDALPPAVDDLMRTRLAAVSPIARQIVETLAVLDRPAADDLVRQVAGRTNSEVGAALTELLAAGVVSVEGAAASLTHRLLGEVALADLPDARIRALHERAAEVLPAAEAADHLALAGLAAKAAALHVRAADEARRVHANRAALDHLRTAVTLGHADGPGLNRQIGDLEAMEGRYPDARRAYELSAAHAVGADLARVELHLARLALRAGDPELASSHLASAAVEASASGEATDRLDVDIAITALLVGVTATPDAIETVIESARSLDDPAAEATAENAAALMAYRQARLDDAVDHALRGIRLAELAAAPLTGAAASNLLGLAQGADGDHVGAVESLEAARGILDLHGDIHRLAAVHANLADALHAIGRDDEAREHQLESARLFSEVSGSPLEGRADIWFLTAW